MNPASLRPIDCDLHPVVPGNQALLPYLDEHWRESVVQRGIHELNSISYPMNAPLTSRPDWRSEGGRAGTDVASAVRQGVEPFGSRIAICNCLYGVQLLFSEDMAAGFARAVNSWIAAEWLDKEPRLRASIVVPVQNPELAVAEIERCAPDKRFVQVLMLVNGDMPLGRRHHWPIYAAAERHGLPIAIHAGSGYRHPVTPMGWPSYYAEDYSAQAQCFQTALTSLICEGVFSKHPNLTVVLSESGFTWLPAYLWRLQKYWHGLRLEIPWVDRSPTEIVRSNVRFTLQPFDAPPTVAQFERLMEHVGSDDLLLFSTDYPHWQFDGDDVLPDGLSSAVARKLAVDNPLKTYPRLRETLQ